MAPPSGPVLPDKITSTGFAKLLGEYGPLLKTISEGKGAREGQQTLEELDRYRYVDAVDAFSIDQPSAKLMDSAAVVKLVSWKLRHGKFRPNLMKLASSNDPSTVKNIVSKAITAYKAKPDVAAALAALCQLKGIGPATASLLLAVHDPGHALFFSDEAFWWLCCGGKKDSIKYNAKEYQTLNAEAEQLVKRLGVKAIDIEKVAYVVMRQDGGVAPAAPNPKGPKGGKTTAGKSPPTKQQQPKKVTGKRKETPVADTAGQTSSRRSKRGRTA